MAERVEFFKSVVVDLLLMGSGHTTPKKGPWEC